MVQPKAATEKPAKVERKDNVLDASKLDAIKNDASTRKTDEGTSKPLTVTAAVS